MTCPARPRWAVRQDALIYHDDLVTTEIGQIGTQFDGPGHIGVNTSKGMFFYNGRIARDSYERGPGGRAVGMGPLGVEYVGEFGFVCRLVVLDAVRTASRREDPGDGGDAADPEAGRRPGIVTATTAGPWSRPQVSARSPRRLRGPAHRPWATRGATSLQDDDLRAAQGRARPLRGRRAGLRHQRLRVSRLARHRVDDGRHVGERRAARRRGGPISRCRAIRRCRRARHLEPREHRHQVADRRQGPGRRFIWSPLEVIGGTGSPAIRSVLVLKQGSRTAAGRPGLRAIPPSCPDCGSRLRVGATRSLGELCVARASTRVDAGAREGRSAEQASLLVRSSAARRFPPAWPRPPGYEPAQLRGARGQDDEGHVPWDDEVTGGVPAGAVEQQDCVSALGECERSRQGGTAWPRCRRRAAPAPRPCRATGNSCTSQADAVATRRSHERSMVQFQLGPPTKSDT